MTLGKYGGERGRVHIALLLVAFLLGCNEANGESDAKGQKTPANPSSAKSKLPIHEISLPPGFSIEVFAENVPNARSLALSPSGTLFVGTRTAGNVYALRDTDGDFRADEMHTITRGKNMPNGVAFRDGSLYVAEVSKVWRYDDIEEHLGRPSQPVLVHGDLPSDKHHGWKYIAFGPDDKLYVPVGAPCNVCDEREPYSCILRMNPDGSGRTVVVRGMRNTVGFAWHPLTGEMWWTDNGRDMWGDERPPDELNRIAAGSGVGKDAPHFGFPYFHGHSLRDDKYGTGKDAEEYVEPAQDLGPHVAALGMCFYTGGTFPKEYRNQIFIAEHGSWNRSVPIGARVMLVRLAEGNRTALSYEVFAEGWQWPDGSRWGRPVDVLVMPDGSLLVSDDHAGAIYRISYTAT